MKKRGVKAQAQIITVVLIILLVLVAIIIVWNVVKPMIEGGSEKVDSSALAIQLKIEQVNVWLTDNIEVRVKRGSGGG